MIPFKVLTTYHWAKGEQYARLIGADLCNITRSMGFKPLQNDDIQRNSYAAWTNYSQHAEVRMTCEPHSQGTGWHQDGDTTVPGRMNFGLILWASRDPTEFKAKGGTVYQAKPFDLVYTENLSCLHRRPPGLSGYRWHFRQRVVL